MESWRHVWRKGIAPLLPADGLELLGELLATDDGRLIQGATSEPTPLACAFGEETADRACAVAVCAVPRHGGFATPAAPWAGAQVGELEEFFAGVCAGCDGLLDEPAACRHFLDWFDQTPRADMVRELLPEVELALAERRRAALGYAEALGAGRPGSPAALAGALPVPG